MNEKLRNNDWFNRAKVIYAAVSWGTMALLIRYIALPTAVIACVRGLIGAVLLYFLGAVATKNWKLDWRGMRANWLWLLVSGVALGSNWIFLFEAYRSTSVAIATLCYYLAPVLVMIASTFLYKEKMTVKKLACICVSLIGLVFISGVLDGNVGNGYGVQGMVFALVAGVLYATVTITGKKMKPYANAQGKIVSLPSSQETLVKLIIAAIVVIPYAMLTSDWASLHPTPMMFVVLVILGIVHTGGAFCAYFSSLHHLENQEVAIITYLDPIVAVIVSLIIGESMNIFSILGAVLLIGALVVYEIPMKKRNSHP